MKKNSTINAETLLAAIDLGSNSFRLEIGRYQDGHIQRVEYLKEAVRQGAFLDEDRNLMPEAIELGVKCLERFGESIKNFPNMYVQAVATQTLREAKNADVFLAVARKALGYDIEVISGSEEARLIYQGVSRFLPQSDERRLVIDIGGRSTEFILGQHFNAHTTDSLHVGSVAWSLKHFSNGDLTEKNFKRAVIAAESVFDSVTDIYHHKQWDVAYGASGTVGAIADILGSAGYPEDRISTKGLEWLREELISAKNASNLKLSGLKDDRKAVIAGGLSILLAIFDLLKIDEMFSARGALRHGLIYDIVADENDDMSNMRESSVQLLAKRFLINLSHATNVKNTAIHLFDSAAKELTRKQENLKDQQNMLSWAAELHEIGMLISHTGSHRHGAYILDHAELMGFSQPESHRLSQLVLGHYGKLTKLDSDFNDISFVLQLISLRLAVILCHSRSVPVLDNILLSISDEKIKLETTENWLENYPQTAYLIEEEINAWQKTDWELVIEV